MFLLRSPRFYFSIQIISTKPYPIIPTPTPPILLITPIYFPTLLLFLIILIIAIIIVIVIIVVLIIILVFLTRYLKSAIPINFKKINSKKILNIEKKKRIIWFKFLFIIFRFRYQRGFRKTKDQKITKIIKKTYLKTNLKAIRKAIRKETRKTNIKQKTSAKKKNIILIWWIFFWFRFKFLLFKRFIWQW